MDTASVTRPEAADRVRLQQMLDELVAAGAMGALAQFRDGGSIWAGSSGVAELGSERPLVPDGWFRIGRVTKTFTAALILQLAGEGRLGLDDGLDRWLLGPHCLIDETSIRQSPCLIEQPTMARCPFGWWADRRVVATIG